MKSPRKWHQGGNGSVEMGPLFLSQIPNSHLFPSHFTQFHMQRCDLFLPRSEHRNVVCINNLLFFCFSLTCKVPLQSTVSVTHKIVNLSVTVIIAFFHMSSRLRLFFAPPIHSQFWEAMGHRASLRPERAFPGISTSHNHAKFISTIHMILMIQPG